jgi:alanine racemase
MRPTHAVISRKALVNNLAAIKRHVGDQVKVCAIVKAEAYGHGLIEIAQTLEQSGVDYLAVAIVEEGVVLRDAGITTPILVMGPIGEPGIYACIKNNLTITAASQDKLAIIKKAVEDLNIPAIIHLKIDTGMGRIGVHWDRSEPLLKDAHQLEQAGSIICEGIYSHFSTSMDKDFTKKQFDRFEKVILLAEQLGLSIPIRHICSSRAVLLYPEYHLTMVRPGLILYGIEPETNQKILTPEFTPVLTWKTGVAYFKTVMQGEFVGYGNTWTPTEKHARIVTLPVGYADGYPRRLSNKGFVLIRGNKYPIVGRVCMDQMMVSLGMHGEAFLDDEVVLLGAQGSETISVSDFAEMIETTPHEITTTISARVPRIYE